jgi:PPOX class probable F420-dependent enzyme
VAKDRGVDMASAAIAEVLDEQRTLTLATIGPDGMPHLAAMWFVRTGPCDGSGDGSDDGTDLLMWTYGTSQKALNVKRDPRASIMAEGGEAYDQLRGVCLDCDVEVVEGAEAVFPIGMTLHSKYLDDPNLSDEHRAALEAGIRKQANKRVGLRFRVRRARSWDHRKLNR